MSKIKVKILETALLVRAGVSVVFVAISYLLRHFFATTHRGFFHEDMCIRHSFKPVTIQFKQFNTIMATIFVTGLAIDDRTFDFDFLHFVAISYLLRHFFATTHRGFFREDMCIRHSFKPVTIQFKQFNTIMATIFVTGLAIDDRTFDFDFLHFVAISYLLRHFFATTHRGFFREDMCIRHSFKPETIQFKQFNTIMATIFVLTLSEFAMNMRAGERFDDLHCRWYWRQRLVQMLRFTTIWLLGMAINTFFLNLFKQSVGSFRPYFVNLCEPDENSKSRSVP